MRQRTDVIFVYDGTFDGFLCCVYGAIVVLKRDWLDEKIGMFDSNFQGISYQGTIVFLMVLSIVSICITSPLESHLVGVGM